MDTPNAPAPSGAFFTFKGVEYEYRPVTIKIRDQMQGLAIARAMELARTAGEFMTREEAFLETQEVRRMALAGDYHWDSIMGWSYRLSKEGQVRLATLCCRKTERENPVDDCRLSLDLANEMYKVDDGKLLDEQFKLANPTQPPPGGDQGGKNLEQDSPKSGDADPTKSAA
jgi:hypothetical protein